MAFAISRNQVLATVLVAGSFLGLASTSAIYADTQTSTGTASVDVVHGDRKLDNVAGSDTTSLKFQQISLNDFALGAVTRTADLTDGAFKVTDYSGNVNGWKLSAAVTNFTAGDNVPFDGGLTLNGVKLTADDDLKASSDIYTGSQRGPWTSPELKKGAAITVPATANVNAGHYTADILYTLSDGVVNH
ncbi:hypothetical protein HAU46_03630 [Weissella confusa]|uniref:hypothetical protein n=1 Tax=Weissella confusa TaxID=1583 RepID=UPI0018F11F58|nr:hypothetical protein [Weissella confusa]MBJ7647091.1 hypothetical protein [Weissella confusa]MBJ7679583.1 hypothetical protein [Weissella confusa]